jgi:hypothetical protein
VPQHGHEGGESSGHEGGEARYGVTRLGVISAAPQQQANGLGMPPVSSLVEGRPGVYQVHRVLSRHTACIV